MKSCTNGKAPSERELDFAKQKTEGECVNSKFDQDLKCRRLLPSRFACHLLATARSRSGSDTTPWCHSFPSRRFATSRRKAY